MPQIRFQQVYSKTVILFSIDIPVRQERQSVDRFVPGLGAWF